MTGLSRLGCVICLGVLPAAAQDRDAQLIDRIRAKVAQTLAHQPNYTCRLKILRAVRDPGAKGFRMLDAIRLEVALIEGQEMFSWPGDGRFENRDLSEFINAGALSSGSFALHLQNVFLSGSATFDYRGEETQNGRATHRFDYRVPREASEYALRFGDDAQIVSLSGAFWAESSTHDLVRLEVNLGDIPRSFAINLASETIEYAEMHIGGGSFRLPAMAESYLVAGNGGALRNRTEFSECHQYAGESSISFGPASPEPDELRSPATEKIDLPAGVTLELAFGQSLKIAGMATGDQLVALVQKDVQRDGRLLVPKGATARGRVHQLLRIPGKENYYVVSVDFHTLEFDNKRARLAGRLEYVNFRAGQSLRISGQPLFDDSTIPLWAR
ncbi:MAG: hypothetical protein GY953_20235, partial [bacterium]|nr:hypothetical protein [bacterium]